MARVCWRGWAVALVASGIALALAGYLMERRDGQAGDVDMATVADRLADQMRDQWEAEARRHAMGQPALPVSWRPADTTLVQLGGLERPAASGGWWTTPATSATAPQELASSGPDLIRVLDQIPAGRLVVLGEPGSGKTVLLIRLVLDLLARREPGEQVPMLVPLASWNPDESDLVSWLERQVIREYPWLSTRSVTGLTRARALLNARLILPVLDGLDEIRAGGRDKALTAINETLGEGAGLVLSSRAKEFRHAIRPGPGRRPVFVAGAAAIRLNPLGPTAVADYLAETAGEGRQSLWAPVHAAMTTTPPPPLARALSTPLMVSLARTVYNPRPGASTLGLPNPADLCDTSALPTRTAVEEHLSDGLIPAAYRGHQERPGQWTAMQAEPFLIFLARHLEHRLCTTSLAWWELRRAAPRTLLILGAAALEGVLAAVIARVLFGSFLSGLPSVLAGGLMLARARRDSAPAQIVPRRPRPADLARGLVVGLVNAFVCGVVVGFAFGLAFGFLDGFAFGPFFGLVFGLGTGITTGLGLGSRADTVRERDPKAVLVRDRANALVGGPAFGLAALLVTWLVDGLFEGLVEGLEVGLVVALVVGLVTGPVCAAGFQWGWLGATRLWLAARRQMPLRLMTFLEDAHERGVLRQAGAVWEFRHASLQRRLANRQ